MEAPILLQKKKHKGCFTGQCRGGPMSRKALFLRNFMFLLCNVILVVLSRDDCHSLFMFRGSSRKDIYDEYFARKSEITVTGMWNSEEEPNSLIRKMGSLETNEEGEDAHEDEEEDGHEDEAEEPEHAAEEMDRRFAEFIARVRERMRSEALLSSGGVRRS